MRILLHDYPGHPFQVQLSRELARRGHHILHLFAGYNQTPRGLLRRQPEDPPNLEIEPIFIKEPLQKYSFFKRWRQEREYGKLLITKIDVFNPEIIISSNTPLDPQFLLMKRSKQKGIPFIFWLQDVTGLATYMILRKKIPLLGMLIGKYYINLERKILRQSDRIILITGDFLTLLRKWGIDQSKAVVIPNWAPIDQISLQPRGNAWGSIYGLDGKICFMYTGTLGLKHNPNLLLDLALHYQNDINVSIVVISETMGADWLMEKKKETSLENLIILDFQPFEQLQYVLASADVLIAILEEDAGVFSVPSKVLTYLCAQRPLLLAVPQENLAARIVNSSQSGLVVRSDESAAFIRAADELLRNPAERKRFGENARKYAEQNFDIQSIADQFENIFIC